jgi:hypothetical protein
MSNIWGMCRYSTVCFAWSFTSNYDLTMIGFLEVCTLSRVNLANCHFEILLYPMCAFNLFYPVVDLSFILLFTWVSS